MFFVPCMVDVLGLVFEARLVVRPCADEYGALGFQDLFCFL